MPQLPSNAQPPFKRPSILRFMGEPILVWRDLWRLYKFQQSYPITYSGDGHPVLVIPGLLGSDLATSYLRTFIRKLGYTPYGWNMGVNMGNIGELDKLLARIEALAQHHQSKVSIIGWSLGGVYARQLGKRRPDLVRQIITLGAPFAEIQQSNNAAWFFKLINFGRQLSATDREWTKDIPHPVSVPTTALYSKKDGIVHWRSCMEQQSDAWHQNIEVSSSHFGLPYVPSIWVIIEDRLQLDQQSWRPFKKKGGMHTLVDFPSL